MSIYFEKGSYGYRANVTLPDTTIKTPVMLYFRTIEARNHFCHNVPNAKAVKGAPIKLYNCDYDRSYLTIKKYFPLYRDMWGN